MISTRRAIPGDAAAIGRIHVDAWQAAYRGQMPDDYLDGLSADDRAVGWHRGLERPRQLDPVFVAEIDGAVAGFAAIGPSEADPAIGEVRAINVAPASWGGGAGDLLLQAAQDELRRLGYDEATLWVLPANARARRFYERHGWTADGTERNAEVLGVVVPEVRYRRRLVGN